MPRNAEVNIYIRPLRVVVHVPLLPVNLLQNFGNVMMTYIGAFILVNAQNRTVNPNFMEIQGITKELEWERVLSMSIQFDSIMHVLTSMATSYCMYVSDFSHRRGRVFIYMQYFNQTCAQFGHF